jgi:hypothetical protein
MDNKRSDVLKAIWIDIRYAFASKNVEEENLKISLWFY